MAPKVHQNNCNYVSSAYLPSNSHEFSMVDGYTEDHKTVKIGRWVLARDSMGKVLDAVLLKAPQVHYITLAPVWVITRINFDPMEHVQYGGCSKHKVGGAGSVVNMLRI